ncbi:hypothetical protein NY2A_b131R [Paramecium bursaria Chlorella virus NY2A]|uniref:Uncharacterized protein b131R n=1 Tax=Paramecium bursaria Chlorella virus NY2A TaxID=46021 RepID=A7IW06_PBCVN|nr:hypothetical protein NY2A_b131R [Paramecium bursaria Chlorella virus NY2A]ABT14530.1 hypothetical protein NY2A_b131R [Paramecium bursaria Chlorella virus NY2A]
MISSSAICIAQTTRLNRTISDVLRIRRSRMANLCIWTFLLRTNTVIFLHTISSNKKTQTSSSRSVIIRMDLI